MKSQRSPPRVLLDEPIGSRTAVTLSAGQANHLNRVLRLRVNARVIVFDGHGAEYLGEIARYQKGGAQIQLHESLPAMPEAALRISLLQGISKADRMDFAIQKSTELGVAEILPVYTQFSVIKLDDARAARRLKHWQRVAGSACEQSGRHFPPRVHRPQPLQQGIAALPCGAPLLAFDRRGDQRLSGLPTAPAAVAAAVGPEGGFSTQELELLGQAGFRLISLGNRILRTETAALVACTLLQARWGELQDLSA